MTQPDGFKSPALVQMFQWMTNPTNYMETARERYGEIFTAQVGLDLSPQVHVSNPLVLQKIFTNESKQFSPFSESFDKFMKVFLGEHSLLRVEGDRHRRQRQLLIPPFHEKRMRTYAAQICSITKQVMSQLDPDKPFHAYKVMHDISLEVIFQVVFGLEEGERSSRVKQILTEWMNAVSSPTAGILLYLPFLRKDLGAWSPWGYHLRLKKQISELLYAEIRERRQQYDPSRTDILTLLLSVRDEADEPMTDEELYDELLTLLLTGHETIGMAMTWMLYWVHHIPSVRDKLLCELDSLGESPDPMMISQLAYLTAVCSESLRIYPVVSLNFPHVVREPVDLMGYQLDPGTQVVANIYLTHHRQDLYPEPKRFKPERFLERQFSVYEYLPFGAGVRRCIGTAMGQLQMKLVLATILQHYQLALSDNRPVRPQIQFNFLLVPAGGVKMVVMGQRHRQERSLIPVC